MRRLAILACVMVLPRLAAADEGEEGGFSPPPSFSLLTASIGDLAPGAPTRAYQTSSRIAAIDDGALVIDADSGDLLRVDAAGALVAEIAIGKDAGLLAYDDAAHRAYVADRRGDRIVVVDVGEHLRVLAAWKTPAEPYAVALSPDRSTLLATTIADRTAVAFDTATGRERWRAQVDPEPRGIAISADGTRASVTSLTTAGLGELYLADHRFTRRALPQASTSDHPRGAFAVTYLGDKIAATAYQIERPVSDEEGSSDHYGGSFTPPIDHELAFFGRGTRAASAITNIHEPRALAWDPARDALYAVGLATDNVIEINHASQVDTTAGGEVTLPGKERCGADGLAVGRNGQLLVWCSFSRQVARVAFTNPAGKPLAKAQTERGPQLVASLLDKRQHDGLVLFHSANEHISAFGGLSCGNCHLEGRSDGQSWLIHGEQLQTPMLCGRVANTGPYKWDGTAPTLVKSLSQTMTRLGGDGLSKVQLASLAAYLEQMPPVRTPSLDPKAVAHGKQLFESAELGCASCHDGPAYTDQMSHKLDGSTHAFDTPSLLGLSSSAPYFHDGSAATLGVLLRDRGHVHGMSDAATTLGERDLADLEAFLKSL